MDKISENSSNQKLKKIYNPPDLLERMVIE